ncbi:hypothetical protein Tco_0074206 [Tanacetum coccineum]
MVKIDRNRLKLVEISRKWWWLWLAEGGSVGGRQLENHVGEEGTTWFLKRQQSSFLLGDNWYLTGDNKFLDQAKSFERESLSNQARIIKSSGDNDLQIGDNSFTQQAKTISGKNQSCLRRETSLIFGEFSFVSVVYSTLLSMVRVKYSAYVRRIVADFLHVPPNGYSSRLKTLKILPGVQVSRPEDAKDIFSFRSALEDFTLLYSYFCQMIVMSCAIMYPLTTQQERKTRKDYGTRRGRSSTSSLSAFGQPSSSLPNDDDNDGNYEDTSRASTPSPTHFVNSLSNNIPQIFSNLPDIDPNMEAFYTRQTKILNRQVQLRDEQHGGIRSIGKGIKNL